MHNHLPFHDRGIQIVVEGPDATGKSTFITKLIAAIDAQLTDFVKKHNFPFTEDDSFCYETDALRSTKTSKALTDIFLSKNHQMSDWTRALLTAACRSEACLDMEKHLRARKVVVCNRWLDSSIIYQANVPEEIHQSIHEQVVDVDGSFEPDIKIIVLASDETILNRLNTRKAEAGLDALEDVQWTEVKRRINQYTRLGELSLLERGPDTYVFYNDGTLEDMDQYIDTLIKDTIMNSLEFGEVTE